MVFPSSHNQMRKVYYTETAEKKSPGKQEISYVSAISKRLDTGNTCGRLMQNHFHSITNDPFPYAWHVTDYQATGMNIGKKLGWK